MKRAIKDFIFFPFGRDGKAAAKDALLEKANGNIEKLIIELIKWQIVAKNGRCPYHISHQYCNEFKNCSDCMDKYYKNREKGLLKKYKIIPISGSDTAWS